MIYLPTTERRALGLGRPAALLAAAILLPVAALAQESRGSARWTYGLEVGATPALLIRWEAAHPPWIFGAGAGAGRGDRHVRARLTPSLRIDRALPAGFRLGAGLGFETVWFDRSFNELESEIQWEVTGRRVWSSGVSAEAGVRWTDYRVARREVLGRLSFPSASSPLEPRDMAAFDPTPELGVPPTLTARGRVDVGVDAVDRSDRGVSVSAANPRGDAAPGTGAGSGENIDRLGMGAEAWFEHGPVETWIRWRSDLHTDPSIRERIDPIADGLAFPVSVSFSGGATLSVADAGTFTLAARHDPQVFLWIPHLAHERTAVVDALNLEVRDRGVDLALRSSRLGRVAGTTIDPLTHARLRAGFGNATLIGVEHERLTLDHRRLHRSRFFVEHRGSVFGGISAGDDLTLEAGARGAHGGWRTEARARYRSEPELMDYDLLLARGWLRPENRADPPPDAPWIDVAASVERQNLRLNVAGFWGDPTWVGDGVIQARGGYMDGVWADTLASERLEARIRVRMAEWGSRYAWWREDPSVAGFFRLILVDRLARLSTELTVRSTLESARSGIDERGGGEVGITLAGPLPALGTPGGVAGQARLEDVFDAGLPVRVGAPLRGRRLVLTMTWTSGGSR